jgi:hypothetical protein
MVRKPTIMMSSAITLMPFSSVEMLRYLGPRTCKPHPTRYVITSPNDGPSLLLSPVQRRWLWGERGANGGALAALACVLVTFIHGQLAAAA